MTIAVCLNCGSMKHDGAFTECPFCGFVPVELEGRAKQLLVTDHGFSITELIDIATAVRQGKKLEFYPGQMREAIDSIKIMDKMEQAIGFKQDG